MTAQGWTRDTVGREDNTKNSNDKMFVKGADSYYYNLANDHSMLFAR